MDDVVELATLTGGSDEMLGAFNAVLKRVHAAAEILGDPELRNRTSHLLMHTVTAELIGQRMLVAVAGPQGAGKSTLVRNVYEIPDQWLPIGLGVGEQLPVMVVEVEGRESGDVRGYAVDLGARQENSTALVANTLHPEAWITGIRGGRPQQLAAVLEVPATFFGVTGMGMLLLPGYEYGAMEADGWSPLMRRSLQLAAGAVIVTDRSRLASTKQGEALKDFRRTAIPGQQPVMVVTKTETDTEAMKEELRESATRSVDVGDGVPGVVVLSGSGPSVAEWRPKLLMALQSVSTGSARARRQRIAALKGLVEVEASDILTDLKLLAGAQGEVARVAPYHETLLHFDHSARAQRAEYETELRPALDRQIEQASKRMREWLAQHAEGWGGAATRLWRFVTLNKGKTVDELDKALVKAWKGKEKPPGFAIAHQDVLDRSIKQGILRVTGYLPGLEPDLASSSGEPTTVAAGTVSDMLSGLEMVNGRQDAPADGLHPDPRSIALIPLMALEVMRLAEVEISEGKALRKLDTKDWTRTLEGMAEDRRLLLAAVVAFIGGDALGGQLDTVSGLATVLQQMFGQASVAGSVGAAAAPVSAGAAVAAAAVLAAVSAAIVLRYMNEDNLRRREEAGIAIRKVGETHRSELLAAYDQAIARLRDILEARLRGLYNVDELTHRRWVLQMLIEDLTLARLELLDRVNADADAMG